VNSRSERDAGGQDVNTRQFVLCSGNTVSPASQSLTRLPSATLGLPANR
jgi:hypothetical protein